MRSRDRLIDVLDTVNGKVVGELDAKVLRAAAETMRRSWPPGKEHMGLLNSIAEGHDSEHIRELAAEALHYLRHWAG